MPYNDGFIPWLPHRRLNLVQIMTTSVCNARCIMCPYRSSWHYKHPGYMQDDLYEKILNDIAEYDPEFDGKFCPYLMNEPFADKKIIERAELAYNILHNPYVEFSSNMELLNEDIIDDLYDMFKRHGFWGKFTISHHGINKETCERIMGINYEKALNNIIYFLQKFQGKMKISIQDMAYSIDKRYVLNHPRQVKRYLVKILTENGIDPDKLIIDPKIFHNRAGNVNIEGWNYDKIVRKIDKDHPFDCLRIHGCLHVLYNGEVVLCCMDYKKEVVIGDLKRMSVKELFESERWLEVKKMVKGEIETPDDFICKRCLSPGG